MSSTSDPRPFAPVGRRGFLAGAAAVAGTAALAPAAAHAAAGGQPADPKASSLPPSADSLVPVSDGQVRAAVAKLDGIITDVIRRTGVPGLATAVVYNGNVVFSKPYGIRDLTTGKPVTEKTVFQLASVSKPLAASAIARAVGRAVLGWSDPIVAHLPGFALADPYVTSHVTVEDMLSHRSGLPGAAGDLLEDLGYDQAYVLGRLRQDPLAPFRTRYAYANFGYTAGADAAAAAAGQSWADFAQANLFVPLGMTQASYRHSDFVDRPDHTAMHVRVDGTWKQLYARNADAQAPAGGASAAIGDLTAWLRMELANGQWAGRPFIDPDAIGYTRRPAILMSPPAVPYARSSFYGLGMDLSDDAAGRVRWSHSGAFFQGAATQVLMLPSASLGIVTLTNGMPIGVPEAIGAYFLDYVEAGRSTRDWLTGYEGLFAQLMRNTSALAGKTPPANPVPAKANSYYQGTYHNAYYGDISIAARADGLHLLIGPSQKNDYPLTHWDGDVFAYYPTGENALGITGAAFDAASGGVAGRVTLEYYDADGLGAFTR